MWWESYFIVHTVRQAYATIDRTPSSNDPSQYSITSRTTYMCIDWQATITRSDQATFIPLCQTDNTVHYSITHESIPSQHCLQLLFVNVYITYRRFVSFQFVSNSLHIIVIISIMSTHLKGDCSSIVAFASIFRTARHGYCWAIAHNSAEDSSWELK